MKNKFKSITIFLIILALLPVITIGAAADSALSDIMPRTGEATFDADDFDNQAWLLDELERQIGHAAPYTQSELDQITTIDLTNNGSSQYDATGQHIPEGISYLRNLTDLTVTYSNLEGELPSFDGNTNLKYIALNNNNLTGYLPAFLKNTELVEIDLSNNYLYGSIPDYSHLQNLAALYLHSNQLTGNIPNTLTELPVLDTVFLQSNQLTGISPTFPINTYYLDGNNFLDTATAVDDQNELYPPVQELDVYVGEEIDLLSLLTIPSKAYLTLMEDPTAVTHDAAFDGVWSQRDAGLFVTSPTQEFDVVVKTPDLISAAGTFITGFAVGDAQAILGITGRFDPENINSTNNNAMVIFNIRVLELPGGANPDTGDGFTGWPFALLISSAFVAYCLMKKRYASVI